MSLNHIKFSFPTVLGATIPKPVITTRRFDIFRYFTLSKRLNIIRCFVEGATNFRLGGLR